MRTVLASGAFALLPILAAQPALAETTDDVNEIRVETALLHPSAGLMNDHMLDGALAVHRVVIASRHRKRPTSAQLTMNARCLIAAVTGIEMEACFALEDWTPVRRRAVLAAQFKAI